MHAAPKGLVARQLELLFRRGAAPQGDRALLDGFVTRGDQAAFEALVARHGPMVRGVCLRLLGSPHDADDAFQATFLVLVQKARGLRDAERLGPWLYGVATRVATRARLRAANRRDRLRPHLDDLPSRDDGAWADRLDVRPILDAELSRLPAKYREVLVACLLEGFTAEEAAAQLRCPLGTVKSRLARGRDALRARLTGRGLAPAVALAVVAGSARSAVASVVPPTLLRATLQMVTAAGPASAGLSPAVVALTRGVAPSMFSKSSMMAAVAFGGLALSGLGIAAWIKTPAVAQDEPRAPGEARPGGLDLARANAGRKQTMNHLRQIMLGMHNYASKTNRFPAAAIYGKDGPLLSWRVAILPFVGEEKLYAEFHLDEPWDSPHNKTLMRRMPGVYRTPNSPVADHATRIQGFQGVGAIFEGTEGVTLADITDGTSNTLVFTLSEAVTVWTRPGDLPFIDGAPLPALDETDPQGYIVALADGSVRNIAKDAKGMPQLLQRLITRNGGEVIEMPDPRPLPAGGGSARVGEAPAPTAGATPAPAGLPGMSAGGASATPASLEQRLQRLEDKLDQVLKRLDAMAPPRVTTGTRR